MDFLWKKLCKHVGWERKGRPVDAFQKVLPRLGNGGGDPKIGRELRLKLYNISLHAEFRVDFPTKEHSYEIMFSHIGNFMGEETICLFWCIWKEGNHKIFNGEKLTY